MSQVLTLSRLQNVDLQKDKIQVRLKAIDRALQDDVQLRTVRQRKTEADAALQQALRDLRNAEEAVRNQNIKIQEAEAALYGGRVQSPKELQDLQHDVASLKRYLVTLEDRQLNAMIAFDEAEAAQNTVENEVGNTEKEFEGKYAGLLSERETLKKNLERLDAERQAIAVSISPDAIQIYDRLRSQRGGVAVAAVVDQSCAACGSELTPADCQAARSPSRIIYCPSCGRILYGG